MVSPRINNYREKFTGVNYRTRNNNGKEGMGTQPKELRRIGPSKESFKEPSFFKKEFPNNFGKPPINGPNLPNF